MLYTQSESITEIAKALNKFQAELDTVSKDKTNPFFKADYATLDQIWTFIRLILTKNDLSVVQQTSYSEGQIHVITTLLHNSGEFMTSPLPIFPKKIDAQGIGSDITYARRYGLCAVLGITTGDDDDGESAMGRGNIGVPLANIGEFGAVACARFGVDKQELMDKLKELNIKSYKPSEANAYLRLLQKGFTKT